MKKVTIYRASTRGTADYGWLKTHYSFSFSGYYNPQRIHFGALRVLNDDLIEGGGGFPTHPHDNMEIITIPFSGALAHKDSMGSEEIIKHGEIQVMSAGTGITHSEYNASATEPVTLFQIWIFPDMKNVKPRYQQMMVDREKMINTFSVVVSPIPTNNQLWIHQNAWLSMGIFDKNYQTDYAIKEKGNGLFVMIIEGECIVEGQKLQKRDAIGIEGVDSVKFEMLDDKTEILIIDVPMM